VTQIEEIECTRELVAQAALDLQRDGIPAADTLPIGVMIETPAAVMLADQIAARADFLSVGSNDLTQYTLALDRGNARLAARFSPHHPAVMQLLKRVSEAAETAGIEASVCGEMASDPVSVFLLIGLGYRVLSVSPPAIDLVRWVVRQIEGERAVLAAAEALLSPTTSNAERVLEEALAQHVDLQLIGAGRLPAVLGSTTFKSS
jgi:phosphotransferase system enzyme I (PtsI)